MKHNKSTDSSTNGKTNDKDVNENFMEIPKLTEEEKENLQVKDGQHNHHVDERGGAS